MSAATPPFPGDVPFSCGWTCTRAKGSSVNLGVMTTSPHVGTHADAPYHVHDAWEMSESLPASAFIGEVEVIALPASHHVEQDITIPTLQRLLGERLVARVLVRTGYTVARGAFPDDWPTLTAESARWLVQRGVKLWGVDAPSVDRRTSKTLPVHHEIFGGGAYLLENLDLNVVPPGRYELLAAPLAVHGADAAPVRALLRTLTP